jgi:hypothetical protein
MLEDRPVLAPPMGPEAVTSGDVLLVAVWEALAQPDKRCMTCRNPKMILITYKSVAQCAMNAERSRRVVKEVP